jgi:hypothetical protein
MSAGPRITMTFFADYAAKSKNESEMALGEFATIVERTNKPRKDWLPWVKFALFGDEPNPNGSGSLRYNDNVLAITGALADYDGEKVTVDDAVGKLAVAGVWAIVYSSPSHTAPKPRWRVGCPVRLQRDPEEHYRLICRLNGILGGILAGESFVLSQSYYFGAVGGNPDHQVRVVEGWRTIDEADDLDDDAIGKPNGARAHAPGAKPEADIADIRAALAVIPNDDRPWESERGPDGEVTVVGWNAIGLAIWRASGGSDEGRAAFTDWSRKSKKFDETETEFRWQRFGRSPPSKIGFGSLVWLARQAVPGWLPPSGGLRAPKGVSLADFFAYMPQHKYIFVPTREFWAGASIRARIGPVALKDKDGNAITDKETGEPITIAATLWLDQNRPVEQLSWAPGEAMVIADRLLHKGGWIDRPGLSCFNQYLPPTAPDGDPALAGMWLDHVRFIYPDDARHIFDWAAQRAQKPGIKINHGLVLGGNQGIGKDTLLVPLRYAIGPWNFQEASPGQAVGRFNGFVKSVVLRISEARDLGDTDRFKFYEHMKAYTAAPPDVLRVDEKYINEHLVLNCCGIVITTNYKDSLYLPADDRRHYVAWSTVKREDPRFQDGYWNRLWNWYYSEGGIAHVVAWLRRRDISRFDPKAPPPKTEAFWAIVDNNQAPEEAELMDLIDALAEKKGKKVVDALTLDMLRGVGKGEFLRAHSDLLEWLADRKNRRAIPHRLERCGYVPVRNPEDRHDGHWKIAGKRQAVYARSGLTPQDQVVAARLLTMKR